MWYCEIEFVSGKNETIVFRNKEEANRLFESLDHIKDDYLIDVYNNGRRKKLNIYNIVSITAPIEYVGEKSD